MTRNWLIAAILLAFVGGPALSSDHPIQTESADYESKKLSLIEHEFPKLRSIRDRDFNRPAIRNRMNEVNDILRANIKNARAWFILGQLHECLGEYESGRVAYKQAANLGDKKARDILYRYARLEVDQLKRAAPAPDLDGDFSQPNGKHLDRS